MSTHVHKVHDTPFFTNQQEAK